MMRLGRRAWAVAIVAAATLHLVAALALFWERADAGAAAPGIGGIEIALGPAGGAPGGPEAAPETAQIEETPEEAVVQEEPVEPEPIVEPEPVHSEVLEAQDAPEPVVEPEAAKPEDTPEPVIEPEAAKPEDAPQPAFEELPAPVPPRKPSPVRPKVEPKKAQNRQPEPQTVGAGGKSGAQDSAEAGTSAKDTSAGGRPGAQADYAAVLRAWLERHKKYPRRAQMRRQEGVVLLYIAIDRKGRVLASRIEKGSGHAALDQAALDMLKRADPLPAIPNDMPQQQLEIVVPVQFFISDSTSTSDRYSRTNLPNMIAEWPGKEQKKV